MLRWYGLVRLKGLYGLAGDSEVEIYIPDTLTIDIFCSTPGVAILNRPLSSSSSLLKA
jgi:hypothetical protein